MSSYWDDKGLGMARDGVVHVIDEMPEAHEAGNFLQNTRCHIGTMVVWRAPKGGAVPTCLLCISRPAWDP